jgi:hypothetical protein
MLTAARTYLRAHAAAVALFLALVGVVVLANWLVATRQPISVGFGLLAPAGVLVAGFAFTVRDLLDEAGGYRWVLAAIGTGALVSLASGLVFGERLPYPGAPSVAQVAVAGAVAYVASEALDWLVYRGLRGRGVLAAVLISGAFGLALDSLVFLWLAFGSLAFLPGQVVGKAYALAASVVILTAVGVWQRRAQAAAW